MKLTSTTLRKIILEELSVVLDENSKQFKMYGSTFSPKAFPGPKEYQKPIDDMLDSGEPEMAEQAKFLMDSIGVSKEDFIEKTPAPEPIRTKEDFIDYARSRERVKELDQDPALYSSKLSAKNVKEKINKAISEPGVKVFVRSFSDTQGMSLGGGSNYDLLVTLEVGIDGYFMDEDEKAKNYKKIKRNLPPEQVQKIENTRKKLVQIFSSAGYKLRDGPINFGGGEMVKGFWPTKQNMSKFSGTYQVDAKDSKPIEL